MNGAVQTTGYIKNIYFFLNILQIFESILQGVASIRELICAETKHNGEERSHLSADFLKNHTAQACAVFHGAAKFIGTFISDRREELADQIGVSRMDLHCIKACSLRTFGSLSVFLYNMKDFILCQRTGNFAPFFGRYIRSGNRLHVCAGGNCRCTCMI